MAKRLALLIGNSIFDHKDFPNLHVPGNDARDFRLVLQQYGGFEILDTPLNAPAEKIKQAIDELFGRAERGDLVLLYYSGHGYRDRNGRHYLIAKDSRPERLRSTAVAESFIQGAMSDSRSRHCIVILDCCFSGAFIKGKKSGAEPLLLEKLKGEASAILASSGKIQYSFEEKGRNSLFTRYLLQGIKTGEADEDGDGMIAIDELFYYAESRVRKSRPEQTPALEIRIRDDKIFIAKRPKTGTSKKNEAAFQPAEQNHRNPDTTVVIENPKQILLPEGAEAILQTIFSGRRRVVIKKKFQGGFSGGQVFLVKPISADGHPELPGVVKLAAASLIQKEWQAYTKFVANRFPGSIRIEGEPTFSPQGNLGGLRYFLAGDGIFEMESFVDYCRRAAIKDIRFALKRLLEVMGQVWQFNRVAPQFHLHASYERYLPVNLFIEVGSIPAGETPHALSPGSLNGQPFRGGEYVRLDGFAVSKVDLNYYTMDLNLPQKANALPASYAIRLKWKEAMPAYSVGEVIEAIEGVIIETRQEKLAAEARRASGKTIDLSSKTVSWPGGPPLPNPLLAWPAILSETRDLKIAGIHGDLNLENILVDPKTRDISLIDFADARQDHVLHDLLRLESEIVTKILAPIFRERNLPPQTIYDFYRQLHLAVAHPAQGIEPPNPALEKPWAMLLAIRQAAETYLFKRDDWAEYYQGLAIYLLGALRFGNLDKAAKQTAFWGSAAAVGGVEQHTTDLKGYPDTKEEPVPDHEQRTMWRKQLDIHRKQLHRLEIQLAKFGSLHAPVYLFSEIDDVKAEIKRLEQLLKVEKQM